MRMNEIGMLICEWDEETKKNLTDQTSRGLIYQSMPRVRMQEVPRHEPEMGAKICQGRLIVGIADEERSGAYQISGVT
jgi:hypothetical protein